MNKATLRKLFLHERKSLSQSEYNLRSQSVCKQAVELIQKSQARNVHLFLPIKKKNEVDTWPLYHWLLYSEEHTPIISKTHVKHNMLSHHPMTKDDRLEESSYGIPEPIHKRTIEFSDLDLIFVPLLAFDKSGNRVGYGAGFYDRFLAQCRPETLKTGLSIAEPTQTAIDTDSFDIALDCCINHEKCYDFRS